MRLKVVTPKSLELARGLLSMVDSNDTTKELVKQKCHHNDGLGGNWNLHQTLSYSSPQAPKKELESESSYIHPLVKKSSMRLSEKSLELCTESLGSETGSDTSESSILSLSLFDSRNGRSSPREERNSSSIPLMESRKSVSHRSFPPPLTTISGSNSLKVRPHREGGRLIIQATEAPSTHSYFQRERSHGRLRLSFWENIDYKFESKMSTGECKETHEEDEVVDVENDMNDVERLKEEVDDQEAGNDHVEYVKTRDMDGNSYDVEVGIGMKKFQRPTTTSRCKEDGHHGHGDKGLVCNWEAFWVATS